MIALSPCGYGHLSCCDVPFVCFTICTLCSLTVSGPESSVSGPETVSYSQSPQSLMVWAEYGSVQIVWVLSHDLAELDSECPSIGPYPVCGIPYGVDLCS